MTERRRIKQKTSFNDRLRIFADDLRAQAGNLHPGTEKDELLRRARQADTASHIDNWVNSPALQPPK